VEGVGKAGTSEKEDGNMTATATATTELRAGTWAIDPVHSSISFWVRHLMVSKVRGKFEKFGGAIVVAEDGTPLVNAEIAVDSVNTGNDQREAHIKSADFFDVENYPVASFTSTGVESDGGKYVLNGQFTLKGVTKPVSLDLEFYGTNPGMGHGQVAGFEASVVLNRKDFGIDIDLPLETGGAVVGDKVTVTLDIEAVMQS
jgi:polyisoprenoid-binding protein YceI